MPFRKQAAPVPVPASPEALYPVLSHGPDAPRELWSRQADVLRSYDGLKNKDAEFPADVAIELPTGAGKTLVGFLIAEWRRRKEGEPVAYVAPTRQLAQQAAALGRLYGIPAVDLTGSHTRWDRSDEIGFRQGDAVACVTYSSVFNANPYITAQTLVLDDAHAAEGFVAANWGIRVGRGDRAFPAVLEVLAHAGAVSADVIRRLRFDDSDDEGVWAAVDLAGIAETAAAAGDLERVLDDAAAHGDIPVESRFALDMIRGSLPACMTYVSHRELLIRPLIAPTRFHDAFGAARHRVYMSATLGDGGELERAFGRRKVTRIDDLSQVIEQLLAPYEEQLQQAESMPGWGRRAAQDTLAETGPDMSRFPSGAHLASWAGRAPLDHQSGKRAGRAKAKKGNRYLGAVTGETVVAAGRTQTREGARHRRLARRRGAAKACVATGNTQLKVYHKLLDRPGDLGGSGPWGRWEP